MTYNQINYRLYEIFDKEDAFDSIFHSIDPLDVGPHVVFRHFGTFLERTIEAEEQEYLIKRSFVFINELFDLENHQIDQVLKAEVLPIIDASSELNVYAEKLMSERSKTMLEKLWEVPEDEPGIV